MISSAPPTRFDAAFAARRDAGLPGLIPYVTAGYPRLSDTVSLLEAAERVGCLAAEVGIPFSDPLADGPTIQRSGQVALANGMTLGLALGQVSAARERGLTIPIALMTYVNPVIAFGVDAFAAATEAAGADGVIVPDLPVDEAGALRAALQEHGVALIAMVAPTTTPERLARICAAAAGFVYCVGVTGVTGSRDRVAAEALTLLDAVRGCTPLPRALGFGLSTHAHLVALAGRAEAAVVGSALIEAIGSDSAGAGASQPGPGAAAERFLRGMLGGVAASTG